MNISGLLITAVEGAEASVVAQLADVTGLEVAHRLPGGRIVATLERETTDDEVAVVRRLYGIDGVVSAVMAYHYFEDETATDR
jgi:nitrate reductase NapAB chaperone NapD